MKISAPENTQDGEFDRVVKVHWYDRRDGYDFMFELRPVLGEFYVSTTMLRAGLRSKPIELKCEEARSTRNTTTIGTDHVYARPRLNTETNAVRARKRCDHAWSKTCLPLEFST